MGLKALCGEVVFTSIVLEFEKKFSIFMAFRLPCQALYELGTVFSNTLKYNNKLIMLTHVSSASPWSRRPGLPGGL